MPKKSDLGKKAILEKQIAKKWQYFFRPPKTGARGHLIVSAALESALAKDRASDRSGPEETILEMKTGDMHYIKFRS